MTSYKQASDELQVNKWRNKYPCLLVPRPLSTKRLRMKRALVYLHDRLAGRLTEDENGYTFEYDAAYLASDGAESVSLTLPLAAEAYHDTVMFPFFDGLIPEGWLLGIAERSWKIDQRDRMSLLLACCKDCIGAVSVVPEDHHDTT